MIAIDTNVLVYAIDAAEPLKQQQANDLLLRLNVPPAQSVLLWQVAVEYVGVVRKWATARRLSESDANLYMRRTLTTLPLILPTADVIDVSSSLHARYSLSHWDSMLLAACIVAGVDTLYSEDLTDGATYDTVKVVNPFV